RAGIDRSVARRGVGKRGAVEAAVGPGAAEPARVEGAARGEKPHDTNGHVTGKTHPSLPYHQGPPTGIGAGAALLHGAAPLPSRAPNQPSFLGIVLARSLRREGGMRRTLRFLALLALVGAGTVVASTGVAHAKQVRFVGVHPIAPEYGGGFCYIEGPHVHIYE